MNKYEKIQSTPNPVPLNVKSRNNVRKHFANCNVRETATSSWA